MCGSEINNRNGKLCILFDLISILVFMFLYEYNCFCYCNLIFDRFLIVCFS